MMATSVRLWANGVDMSNEPLLTWLQALIHLSAHFSNWREETPRLEGCKSAVSWTPESPHENMSRTLQRVRRGRNTERSLPWRGHRTVKVVQYTLRRLHERIGRDKHSNRHSVFLLIMAFIPAKSESELVGRRRWPLSSCGWSFLCHCFHLGSLCHLLRKKL